MSTHKQQHHVGFSYPILSERDIVQCLHELGLTKINSEQLQKPTYETVQYMFENLVVSLCGVSREELQQPMFAAIDVIDYAELHDESIPAMAFFVQTAKLMRASGVRDFSMKDLHKPDVVRLKKHLSAIINFAKFREEKLLAYTELQEKHEELIDSRDALKREQEELEKMLAKMTHEWDVELPEVANVEADIEFVYAENQSLNKQQAALSHEVKALKEEVAVMTDESSKLNIQVNTARGRQEDLRAQIVQSPHKIKAMLDDIANALEMEQASAIEAEKRARELASKLDAALRIEKELSKTIASMQETDAEIKKKKEVSKRVKTLRLKISGQEHEITQLETTHQHLHRQKLSLAERIERVKAQCEVRKQAAQGRVEEQLRHREAIEAGNAAAVAKLNQNEASIRAIESQISDLQSSHENQITHVLRQYYSLMESVEVYQQKIERCLISNMDDGSKENTEYSQNITQTLLSNAD
jgi:kinetochore protein Nuf2